MPKQKKILVTGGTGFIGGALLLRLEQRPDLLVSSWVRRADQDLPAGVTQVLMPPSGFSVEVGTEVVIHCAGRAHVAAEMAADPLAEFRRINVDLTLSLARQAVAARVRRFIFLSSAKVHGEATPPGQAFTEDNAPAPADPYALSKLEAEQGLLALAKESNLEVVIVRPSLVYGPGVKANFLTMMRWLSAGIPLPLGAVDNRRSLVALDNLVDLLVVCMDHPAAANQVFLAADGDDISTSELLRRLSRALGVPARLLPVPQQILGALARLSGRAGLHEKLCGSLQVDSGKARRLLGWSSPVDMREALARTAENFSRRHQR